MTLSAAHPFICREVLVHPLQKWNQLFLSTNPNPNLQLTVNAQTKIQQLQLVVSLRKMFPQIGKHIYYHLLLILTCELGNSSQVSRYQPDLVTNLLVDVLLHRSMINEYGLPKWM